MRTIVNQDTTKIHLSDSGLIPYVNPEDNIPSKVLLLIDGDLSLYASHPVPSEVLEKGICELLTKWISKHQK